MSLQNPVFKNRSGDYYKVIMPRENPVQLSLKSEYFWSEESAQQFISTLTVPSGYWRDILHQYSTLPCPSSLSCYEIEKQVASLVLHKQINFYSVDVPDAAERPPENRVIKSSDDILYSFVATSTLLLNKEANTETFNSKDEVKSFISGLNPDDNKIATIASELKITVPNTASVNKNEMMNSIAEAIISGEVVIISDKISSPPSSESIYVEAKNTIGNKKADLGPHETEDPLIHWFDIKLVNECNELYERETFIINLSDKSKEKINKGSAIYRKEKLPSGSCTIEFPEFYQQIEEWFKERSH